MGESIRSTTSIGSSKASVSTKKLSSGAISMSRRITTMSAKIPSALAMSNRGESANNIGEPRSSSLSRVVESKTVIATKANDLAPGDEVADWLDMPRIVENKDKKGEPGSDDIMKVTCSRDESADWSSEWLTSGMAELRQGGEDSTTTSSKSVRGEGEKAETPTASVKVRAESVPLVEDNVESQVDIGEPLVSTLKQQDDNETSSTKQTPDEYVTENPDRSEKAANDRGDLTNEENASSNDSSPNVEAAALEEELMAVKLELATAHAENEYYQRILKETKLELEMYRSRCIQYEKQSFKKLSMARPFVKKK